MNLFHHTTAIAFLALVTMGCATMVAAPEIENALPAPDAELAIETGATEASVVVAGGCFWCTEFVFEQIEGVPEVVSGYAGGTRADADYQKVARGLTDHAESIRITFDPAVISYAKVLQVFFTMHHPTQKDGQTPDFGRQYRSAVFYQNDAEKQFVESYIRQLDASGMLSLPVVTTIEPLTEFFPAEDYHQDYVVQHPDDRYVRQWAIPKVRKVKKLFPELIREIPVPSK